MSLSQQTVTYRELADMCLNRVGFTNLEKAAELLAEFVSIPYDEAMAVTVDAFQYAYVFAVDDYMTRIRNIETSNIATMRIKLGVLKQAYETINGGIL